MPVELIPKGLVVGLFAGTPPGAPDRERLNRVWAELSGRQEYRQFSLTGEGATFVGVTADDALVIQPPLVQFRSGARLGAANAADEARVAIKAVAKHMGWNDSQFFNLGIKHVYNAPPPNGHARQFMLDQLLHLDTDRHGGLERGGDFWAGLKYGAPAPDGSTYIVTIEPLLKDDEFLFIDVDAAFPGPANPDRIVEKASEAHEYANQAVRQYLEAAL